jgi:hypothetical protein
MATEIVRRWESTTRYYSARLYTDLLGDVVIESAWGGRFNKLGGSATLQVDSAEEGAAVLDQLDRERLARRYQRVS